MPISDKTILDAALAIASVPGLEMNPDDLLEDTFLLARSFPEEDEFKAATAATVRAIANITGRKVTSAWLKYAFEGWLSYHYQHRVSQGGSADCRIVFRETEGGVEVKAFGHRKLPADIYERMTASRK